MSVEAMAIVLHHSQAQGAALAVLIGIANHAGDGGAWPSVATLAKYGRCSERSVQRSLHQLVGLGEIVVHLQAGGLASMRNHERPNRYDLVLACPATCDRTANHRPIQLPRSQSALWIEGATHTSPGDASVTRGATPTSPGGATPTSPEPSIEPSLNPTSPVPTQPQHARGHSCDVCSLPEVQCQRRYPKNGHMFTPRSAS